MDLPQQIRDFLPMGRQDLRRLAEYPGLFLLDMLLDVHSQRLESCLKRRIVIDLL